MAELLVTVMQDSKVGVVWIALSVVVGAVVIKGFKIEWIGNLSRHVYLWLRCKIFDKHCWEPSLYFSTSAEPNRSAVCRICGKRGTRE